MTRNAKSAIPSCALDEQGIRDQQARYRRLAASVTNVVRSRDALLIDFAPCFDRQALDGIVEVERRCCPFFRFAFHEQARRLTLTVADPEHAEAVGAVAAALGAPQTD
jgi:hypothetical protein